MIQYNNLLANNLILENLQVEDNQTIRVDIAWDNAWNLTDEEVPFNYDAVWLFAKYRKSGGEKWQHISLSSNTNDHNSVFPTVVGLEAVADGKGVMAKAVQKGSHTVFLTPLKLRVVGFLPDERIDIRVFGIEMVYIPEGGFWVGDGGSLYSLRKSNQNQPYFIAEENKEILVNQAELEALTAVEYRPEGTVSANYPKGVGGFYCMKYELTQEQYKDFLNTLTFEQQDTRTANSPTDNMGSLAMGTTARNGITIRTQSIGGTPAIYTCNSNGNSVGNETEDGHNRACNFLSWADLAAYLDWAALRPMTGLEFEKINRGTKEPFAREFAWGTTRVSDANTVINDGTMDEEVIDQLIYNDGGLANFSGEGVRGPLRVGFAAKSTTSRLESGAGYYGAMEMSGNLWEQCINLSNRGLQFDGTFGDGYLATNGNSNVSTWPSNSGNGAGLRGGSWNSKIDTPPNNDMAISDRFYAYQVTDSRRATVGGRGAR